MLRRAGGFTVLLALACNDLLGLDAGTPKSEAGSGGTTSDSPGGDSGAPSSGAPSSGGTSSGGTSSGGVPAGGAPACSTTADCSEQGLATPQHLCLAGACVGVLTEECDTLLGTEWLRDHPDDEPLVFGAVAENVDELSASYFGLDLAMREFAEHGPVPIDGAPRTPLLLVCRVVTPDPFSSPTQRSLDHLLDEVHVPGIVMIQSRAELLASIQYALGQKQADALFIDTGSANIELVQRQLDGGLLWHMSGDASGITFLYYPLIRLVEEHVNPGASSGNGARLTRVVMVPPLEEDGLESALARAVEGAAFTNNRLMVEYPDTYRTVIVRDRPYTAASEVMAFEPDIVIDFAGLYRYTELHVQQDGAAPPFYILPPSQARSPLLGEQLATNPTLYARLLGVDHAGPDEAHRPLYDAYLERFAAIAPAGVDGFAGASAYEAVYFLMYAAVAEGTGGSNMNLGMTRLLGLLTNERRDIGPTSIDSVIELLGSAPSLSLHGPLGPPSFAADTGSRTMPGSVWCVDENQELVMDALRPEYDGGVSIGGTLPCFEL